MSKRELFVTENTRCILTQLEEDKVRRRAALLIGVMVDKHPVVTDCVINSRLEKVLTEQVREPKEVVPLINFSCKLSSGKRIVGVYTSSDVTKEYIEWLFNEMHCDCSVQVVAHSLPEMVVHQESHITAHVSVPFPIRYSDIQKELDSDFVSEFCHSLYSQLCVFGKEGILKDSDPCPEQFSFLLKRTMFSCDDIVPINFILDICLIDGETIGELKHGVCECLECLFRQTITLSDLTGCRIWQNEYRWENSYLHVDSVEHLVYEMNDHQKNSFIRQLGLVLMSLFIVFIFLRIQR